MRLRHNIINKAALAEAIGMKPFNIGNKLKHMSFTEEEFMEIRKVLEDMVCYVFEVDEIIFEDNKIKGA